MAAKNAQDQAICATCQSHEPANAAVDEKVLRSFHAKPSDDVFSPPMELKDEVVCLISRLRKKADRLPPYFEALSWVGYLRGNAPRQIHAKIACGTGDYLCQLLEYGTAAVKEDLKEEYTMEVSVTLRLRKLCMDYRKKSLSDADFDQQFLQLAKEFCSDIPE